MEAAFKFRERDYLDFLLGTDQLGQHHHAYTPHLNGLRHWFDNTPHGNGDSMFNATSVRSLSVRTISRRDSPRRRLFYQAWSLNTPFRFIDAVDYQNAEFEPRAFAEYRDHLRSDASAADLQHLACSLSHFATWRNLASETTDLALVLEDDALPTVYGPALLNGLLSRIPEDADIVFVNGRSADKLYCGLSRKPPYEPLPDELLVPRSLVAKIMSYNYDNLPTHKGNRIHWSGTDGYLLTRAGLGKLLRFVDHHGLPPFSPLGGETNIDILLGLLTLGRKDCPPNPVGFNPEQADRLGLYPNDAYLNAYVAAWPLVDCMSRFGIFERA